MELDLLFVRPSGWGGDADNDTASIKDAERHEQKPSHRKQSLKEKKNILNQFRFSATKRENKPYE